MAVTAILSLRLVHLCLRGQREASGGAHFGRSIGDWIRLGSSERSCWNCVSMSGVGLSVSVSSWSPSGDGGAGLVEEGGAGRSNCAG